MNNNSVPVTDNQDDLRELFLKIVKHLHGKQCTISMYEKTNVNGVFSGCDVNLESMAVSSLETPLGSVPHALLRKSDIVAIKFPSLNLMDFGANSTDDLIMDQL